MELQETTITLTSVLYHYRCPGRQAAQRLLSAGRMRRRQGQVPYRAQQRPENPRPRLSTKPGELHHLRHRVPAARFPRRAPRRTEARRPRRQSDIDSALSYDDGHMRLRGNDLVSREPGQDDSPETAARRRRSGPMAHSGSSLASTLPLLLLSACAAEQATDLPAGEIEVSIHPTTSMASK